MKTLHKPEQSEERQPRNAQRTDIIPTDGFIMVVDGKLNLDLTMSRVRGRLVLSYLVRFPMLRVEVYNAETRVRTKVEAAS